MGEHTRCGIHGWNTDPDPDHDGARWCPECTPERLPRPDSPEAAARAAAAIDLADHLGTYGPRGANIATVKALPRLGWQGLAEGAGWADGYVPSVATRVTVVRLLEERAKHPDPFAGFPA